jgi:hypothetical protein
VQGARPPPPPAAQANGIRTAKALKE